MAYYPDGAEALARLLEPGVWQNIDRWHQLNATPMRQEERRPLRYLEAIQNESTRSLAKAEIFMGHLVHIGWHPPAERQEANGPSPS